MYKHFKHIQIALEDHMHTCINSKSVSQAHTNTLVLSPAYNSCWMTLFDPFDHTGIYWTIRRPRSFSQYSVEWRNTTNASWFNHSECASEYNEAISVNMGWGSASLSCPVMEDLHSEHLIPKRIKVVSDLLQRLDEFCLLICSLHCAGCWGGGGGILRILTLWMSALFQAKLLIMHDHSLQPSNYYNWKDII